MNAIKLISEAETRLVLLKKENNKLVPDGNDVDPIALLRARTLLAYLMEKNLLHYENNGSYVVVHRKGFPLETGINVPDGALAGVLYEPFAPIREQPAIAFYRSTNSMNRMFNNVWLRSSLGWLNRNQPERIDLDIAFANAGSESRDKPSK